MPAVGFKPRTSQSFSGGFFKISQVLKPLCHWGLKSCSLLYYNYSCTWEPKDKSLSSSYAGFTCTFTNEICFTELVWLCWWPLILEPALLTWLSHGSAKSRVWEASDQQLFTYELTMFMLFLPWVGWLVAYLITPQWHPWALLWPGKHS